MKRMRWYLAYLGVALLVAGGCSTVPPTADQQAASDVQQRLSEDVMVRKQFISVTVTNGVATLQGSIPSETMRKRVVGIVEGTPGIQKVNDCLQRR